MVGFLTSSSTTRLYRGRAPRQERLTILRAATHETELGDHDFCLSRSHYTDTDPTCRERAATAGIEPGTSSPGVARSTAQSYRAPQTEKRAERDRPREREREADRQRKRQKDTDRKRQRERERQRERGGGGEEERGKRDIDNKGKREVEK